MPSARYGDVPKLSHARLPSASYGDMQELSILDRYYYQVLLHYSLDIRGSDRQVLYNSLE